MESDEPVPKYKPISYFVQETFFTGFATNIGSQRARSALCPTQKPWTGVPFGTQSLSKGTETQTNEGGRSDKTK